MRARTLVPLALAVLATAVLAVTLASCGDSGLAKAFPVYDSRAEKLLDRDLPLWTRLMKLYNEQISEDTADPPRYEACVTKEAVPFYDDLVREVEKLEAGDPALAPVQAEFLAYAKSRSAFAHHLADNLGVFRPGAADAELAQRRTAADAAMQAYAEKIQAAGGIPDERFNRLVALEAVFRDECMKPLTDGKMTSKEVEETIAARLLPQCRKMRAEKYPDDEVGHLLSQAVAAGEEFYVAVSKNLTLLDRNARFSGEAGRLVEEGDEHLKTFQAELGRIRRRL